MSLDSRILDLLRDARKIEAIKLFREETGCGLAEAKYAVEQIEARSGIRDRYGSSEPDHDNGGDSGGCGVLVAAGVLLILLLAAAGLAFWVLA